MKGFEMSEITNPIVRERCPLRLRASSFGR